MLSLKQFYVSVLFFSPIGPEMQSGGGYGECLCKSSTDFQSFPENHVFFLNLKLFIFILWAVFFFCVLLALSQLDRILFVRFY